MGTLSADTWKLYEAGKETLPAAAAAYSTATGKLGGSSTGDFTAFQRPGLVGPGRSTEVAGQVYPSWAGLRNDLQSLLGETSENLRTAGQGLVHIAHAYAKIDTGAAENLKRLGNTIDDKSDDVPPVTKPKELYT